VKVVRSIKIKIAVENSEESLRNKEKLRFLFYLEFLKN
jgi:hypothetical protein